VLEMGKDNIISF